MYVFKPEEASESIPIRTSAEIRCREIVDLARFSPSWKNTQVVRYHVVKNADLKEKIAQNCVLALNFNAKTIVRCNALVIVSVVTKVSGYESGRQLFDHAGGPLGDV